MISHACPIIILDDDRQELWQITHGLGFCGLPVMPHLVLDGQLERQPDHAHKGIRLLFTDLHLLGPTQTKPEQYISALIKFIEKLISPTTYLIVFWSNYPDEAEEAWQILNNRIKQELKPFGYATLSKNNVKAVNDDDPEISKQAMAEVRVEVKSILDSFPQLKAVMEWESNVSKSAAETTNELVQTMITGGVEFTDKDGVKSVLARMSQEALGYPHAQNYSSKGLTQALLPIVQEWLERNSVNGELSSFLGISDSNKINLPKETLVPLLNNFFTHSEGSSQNPLDRGAITRLSDDYLTNKTGFAMDIGVTGTSVDWQESLCNEFVLNWSSKTPEQKSLIKIALNKKNVYAVELSADCDHAQNKSRTQRFLFAVFVPETDQSNFYSRSKNCMANDSIYVTPKITIEKTVGQFFISCRVFISKPFGVPVDGCVVTLLRKDVITEVAHHYSTYMRRPGKIAFF